MSPYDAIRDYLIACGLSASEATKHAKATMKQIKKNNELIERAITPQWSGDNDWQLFFAE